MRGRKPSWIACWVSEYTPEMIDCEAMTVATVIASQAIISGAFSLTQQAIQLDFLPRLHVLHTAALERAATEGGAMMEPTVELARAGGTVGEWTESLERASRGRYTPAILDARAASAHGEARGHAACSWGLP